MGVSYLLRVVLPDRPGALGAVATALGTVGGDILSVDVIERSPGSAIDDLVVDLPPDRLADTLVTAASAVDGVRVTSIRQYAGTIDPHRELEVLEALARRPGEALAILADGVTRIFRAGWALVIDAPVDGTSTVLTAGGGAPDVEQLATPWLPIDTALSLAPDPRWAPEVWDRLGTELAAAPMGRRTLLVGRPMMAWAPSELVRLHHLAAITTTVLASEDAARHTAAP